MESLFATLAEMGPYGHEGPGPWIIFPALLWTALLGLAVWGALRVFSARQEGGRTADSAEEILRQRFARGEVDAETYRSSLDTLRGESSQRSYEDFVREEEERLRPEDPENRQ